MSGIARSASGEAPAAAGLVVGVLAGGVLTRAFGWESVFLVNVPLAGIALVLTFVLIDADRQRDQERSFDLPGALSATGAITLLVFALVQGPSIGWSSPASCSPQYWVCFCSAHW